MTARRIGSGSFIIVSLMLTVAILTGVTLA